MEIAANSHLFIESQGNHWSPNCDMDVEMSFLIWINLKMEIFSVILNQDILVGKITSS